MTNVSSFYEPLGKSLSRLKDNIAKAFIKYSNAPEEVVAENDNTPNDLGHSGSLSLSQLDHHDDQNGSVWREPSTHNGQMNGHYGMDDLMGRGNDDLMGRENGRFLTRRNDILGGKNEEFVTKKRSKGGESGDTEALRQEYIKRVGTDFTQVGLNTYIEAVRDARMFRERCFYTLSRRPYADCDVQGAPTDTDSAKEASYDTPLKASYSTPLKASPFNTPLKVSRMVASNVLSGMASSDNPTLLHISKSSVEEHASQKESDSAAMSYDEKLKVLQRIGIGDDYIANKVCSRYTPSRETKTGKLKPLAAFSMYTRQSDTEASISQEFKVDTPIRIFTPTNKEPSAVFKQISSKLDKNSPISDPGKLFLPVST